MGLGAGSSPACCCYFMYLKALNSCFFGWSPIDQHLYLFSQLASTLQWSELDVLSHLAWTQVVLWREKCAPSTHTSHSSPFILYPPIPTSGVLGARGLVFKKLLYAFFVGAEAKGVEIRRGTHPLASRRSEGKVQLSGGESIFFFIF